MLPFLNIFFFVFHTGLVLFNMTGWMFKKTRRWNLITLGVTLGSWIVLGFWKGFGYCACTDYHWKIRQEMGLTNESDSYIHFLILKLTGLDVPGEVVLWITGAGFVISVGMSITLNLRDFFDARSKRAQRAAGQLTPP